MPVKSSVMRTLTVPSGLTSQMASSSDERSSITFFPTRAGDYTVNVRPVATANDGIGVTIGGGPITFTAERDGSVVKDQWHAAGAASVTSITILEVFG